MSTDTKVGVAEYSAPTRAGELVVRVQLGENKSVGGIEVENAFRNNKRTRVSIPGRLISFIGYTDGKLEVFFGDSGRCFAIDALNEGEKATIEWHRDGEWESIETLDDLYLDLRNWVYR